MRYFHGTSYAAGMDIIQNGFKSGNKIWSCSDPNMIYLVSEHYDNNTSENCDIESLPAFLLAIEAGQIAAAHNNQTQEDLFLFQFDIPDNVEIEEDDSCENMIDCYQIDTNELNNLIADHKINMTIYQIQKAYVPYLKVFYLKDLSDKYYRCENASGLRDVINQLKTVDSCWFYEDYVGKYDAYTIVESNLKIA